LSAAPLTALFSLGATTTYGYDAFGARVYQIVATTSTSTYPFKFFSIASTTKSSTNYATSTEFVFNSDTLISTVDQAFKNGAATGTAAVRYVHPDHLGSTNVVTDQNQNLVQTLDYYPFGAIRVSVSTSTNQKRKFITQFSDDSGLDYLNARFYNPTQGQFVSQDASFLAIGNPNKLKELSKQDQQKFLSDPEQMNSYNYARNNPISNKDPDGNSLVDSVVIKTFKGVSSAKDMTDLANYGLDFQSMYGNPNVPASQQVGTAVDIGVTLGLMLLPTLAPAAVTFTFWDVFVAAGEKITGRPASDSGRSLCRRNER
jgi:RHS repeat-associated protein